MRVNGPTTICLSTASLLRAAMVSSARSTRRAATDCKMPLPSEDKPRLGALGSDCKRPGTLCLAHTGVIRIWKQSSYNAPTWAKAGARGRTSAPSPVTTIEFSGGAIDCVVRNLSDTGAALEVASPLGIPQAFNLLISGDRTTYQCEVRWRKENRIGVAFR
jgi:hypothetical protein